MGRVRFRWAKDLPVGKRADVENRIGRGHEEGGMSVTLLPGESTVFMITGAVLKDPEALGRHPVLRCVNDTVTR